MPKRNESPITPRAEELIRAIKPNLEEGEFVLILTKEFNGLVVVPDEVTLKAKIGKMDTTESLAPVILASQLLNVCVAAHGDIVTGGKASKLIPGPGLVGPDGKPTDN